VFLALVKKLFFPSLIFFLVLGWFASLLALPKEQKPRIERREQPPSKPPRPTPLVLDDDLWLNPWPSAPTPAEAAAPPPAPAFRPLGPSRVQQASVPYVNVRVGHPEIPGGNNHMRRQVKASPNGVVHMAYRVWDGVNDTVVGTADDSNTNGTVFYNAYDCGGSNALAFGSKDVHMKAVFSGINDTRPRVMIEPGVFVPNPATGVPIVYGARFIQRTDLGRGLFSRRGWATMKDGAECLGVFSMDTSQTTTTGFIHPVMHPLNESTWVATGRSGGNPNAIAFSYTTNRGLSWSAITAAPTYSPWFNSVEITSKDTTFYILSMTDPADINAFATTERPVYLRGDYHPATGTITFGTMTDIYAQAGYSEPLFLPAMLDIAATMVGDTVHVAWVDWNGWLGQGIPGPGGHVHHARILPDGSVPSIQKIADINIDGRLPKISSSGFGFATFPWSQIELSYDEINKNLYCIWEQPPPDSSAGRPNYQWADYERYGVLSCHDLFLSASPNHGRGWDEPTNITQTNNPGCTGNFGDECDHEYWFSADDQVANDTVWIVAINNRYPGFQESPVTEGDIGPWTQKRDAFRLYKTPARPPILSLRASLGILPGDTIRLDWLTLKPRAGITSIPLQLTNLGLIGFFLDSVKVTGTLNDGGLVTATDAAPGTFIPSSSPYDFSLNLNTSGVSTFNQGMRSGSLVAYVHTDDPSVPPGEREKSVQIPNINVWVLLQNLCLNRKVRIHSATNFTDIGTQGSIKDQGGYGMYYAFNGSDRFYDGGVWITNSDLTANNNGGIPGVPRKTTRQLFGDKFLRCVSDGVLDSVPGTGGGYYNLFLKSVATDLEDTTLVWQNLWEQSTHPDSSDFLIQTTRVINIGGTPIDSVAMGAIYDIDILGVSNPAENTSGDTSVAHLGRKFWLGWVSGNDVAVDTCAPNNEMYGVVVIPDGIGNPGDSIHPRGAVVYKQAGFSYNIGFGNIGGGDSLCERYSWKLTFLASTRDRQYDAWTGVWQDTLGASNFICGNPNAGPPYRGDMGYLTIAKKVNNFPINGGGQFNVGRYGMEGLVASVDSFFSGPGESYSLIHVGSNSGLAGLMANARTAIDWYTNHANYQVGTKQTALKGDLNDDGQLSPIDAMLELNYIFLEYDGEYATSICQVDLNNDQNLTPADVIFLLNGIFLGTGCPNCLRPCI
jgi:hypothetical protein